MDFEKLLNNLTIKKIVVIVLMVVVGLWLLRELFFWEFVHSFKNVYSQFTTQFDQDQKTIHNIIQDNFKKQQEMDKEMDKRSEAFHRHVDSMLNSRLSYLQNSHSSQQNQKISNTTDEIDAWESIRKQYFDRTGKTLPTYDELIKHADMLELDNIRDKELTAMEKQQDQIRATWKKQHEEVNKKTWREVQLRYVNRTGKTLPDYEELKQHVPTMKALP